MLKVSSMAEIEEPFELKSHIKATSPLSPVGPSSLTEVAYLYCEVINTMDNQHNGIIAPRCIFMWQDRERERETGEAG